MVAIVDLQRGIPSKRESSARADYVPALCTHRPSLLPIGQLSQNLGLDPDACGDVRSGLREVVRAALPRGSKSRNKVSVGEPAEGSLTCMSVVGRRGFWFFFCGKPTLSVCEPPSFPSQLRALLRGDGGSVCVPFFDALCRCDNYICLLSLNKREQLPTVDPLARASMKTVAKRDSVL